MILDSDGEELLSKSCGTTDENYYDFELEINGDYGYYYDNGAGLPDSITFTKMATLVFYSDYNDWPPPEVADRWPAPGFLLLLSEEVNVVITQLNNEPGAEYTSNVQEGLCSPETTTSLIQQRCINKVWSLSLIHI